MTDRDDDVLRRSLDAVDRQRTWLMTGIAVAVLALLVFFYHGTSVMRADTNGLVNAIMLMLGVWMTMLTLAVVIHVTVMTKRVLRAIEIATKK